MNEKVLLLPLKEQDFDELYVLAADPEVWSQHPNKDRWKKQDFTNYFKGALHSGGAYKIVDQHSKMPVGCTRYYDFDPKSKSIYIGYTFFGKSYWGKGYNQAVKTLMLDHILHDVETVYFHIGAENLRSQSSIVKIGAVKIAEEVVTYFGEQPRLNFLYELQKVHRQQ